MTETSASSASPPALRPVVESRRFAAPRAITALILREMVSTYGRTPLGYLWAVLEPVAGIALLTVIFSMGFRSPPLGTNFPIFYASGLVPFVLYMDVSNKVMDSLRFSSQLLVYPRVTFTDAILARFILNLLTQLLVAYILFSGIVILFDARTAPALPGIALGLAMAASLGLGIGTLNCFLIGVMPAWQRVWAILNRPLFLISCIFFLFESVPEPFRSILWYNPLVHVVGQTRSGFYPYYEAPYVSLIYVFGIALISLLLGLVFLRRYARFILQN